MGANQQLMMAHKAASGGSSVAFVKAGTTVAVSGGTSGAPSIGTVAAGNAVVIVCRWMQQAATSAPPTISGGWSTALNPNGTTAAADSGWSEGVTVFYKVNSAGGTESATVTFPNVCYGGITITEYSNVATTSAVRETNSSIVSSTTTSAVSGTTAGAADTGDLVVVAVAGGARTFTTITFTDPPSGYTSLNYATDANSTCPGEIAYKIASGAGAQSASWTIGTASSYAGGIAVFKHV